MAMDRQAARSVISAELEAGAATLRAMTKACGESLFQTSAVIAEGLRGGGKLMLCGNGGSAADAQHLAAELVGRMTAANERPGLAAVALTTDSSVMTALGNDYDFERIFARQIEALGRPGDVLLAISTSGDSPNVLRAVEAASRLGLTTAALTGRRGRLRELVDVAVIVPSDDTQHLQEGHIAAGHIICGLVERMLAPAAPTAAVRR